MSGTSKLDSYDAVLRSAARSSRTDSGEYKTNIVVPGDEPRVLMPGFGRDGGIDRNPTPELLDALTRLLEAFGEGTAGKAQPIVDLNFNLDDGGDRPRRAGARAVRARLARSRLVRRGRARPREAQVADPALLR